MAFYAYVGIVLLRRRRDQAQFSTEHARSELALGLLLGGAFISTVVLVLVALGVYTFKGVDLNDGFLLGIALGVGAGIMEEVIFRGILLEKFFQKFGPVKAILFVSLIFGAFHSLNTIGSPDAQVLGPLSTAVAGAMLCAAYFVYRRVWFAMGVHIAWNFTLFGVFGLFTSGISSDRSGLFVHTISGDQLLTGGSFGPEASVVAIVLEVLITVILLYVANRRGNFEKVIAA